MQYIGYQSAQVHYANLKKQFFSQLELNTLQQNNIQLQQFKQQLENELAQSQLKDDLDKSAGQIVNQIFNDLVLEFEKDANIQQWKERAISILETARYNKQKLSDQQKSSMNKALKNEITEDVTHRLNILLLKYLRKNTTGSSANAKDRYSAVLSDANAFLLTYLKASYSKAKKYKLYGWPMKTLAGYINEDLSYRGLKQIFQNTNMHITPGGTKKGPDGKLIEMDNIISSIGSLSGLNKQLTITTNTDAFLEDYAASLSSIKYFGEQVKSFSLGSLNINNRERIANRAELRDAYKNQTGKNYLWSYIYNREFMGLYKNILTTFRPDTLFFTGKDQKMFMDEFISNFRKQGFLLQLEWDDNPKKIVTDKIVLVHESTKF